MPLKRNAIVFKVIVFFMLLLCIRFLYIQLINNESMARAASSQRVSNVRLGKTRGDILDRNGIPFTNRKEQSFAVLKPLVLKDDLEQLKHFCDIAGVDFSSLKDDVELKKEPIILPLDDNAAGMLDGFDLNGVTIVNALKRYDQDSLAKHILGYLNETDQTGAAGLEKYYEKVLNNSKMSGVAVITDGAGGMVPGLGYRLFGYDSDVRKLNVKLTLDYHIQKIVEEVMDAAGVTGTVVIEDVTNGDIVAVASKPDFDPNKVEMYLKGTNNELFNRAVASYNAGSIFKIIDTAQALEADPLYNDKYYCTGSIRIGNMEFKCASRGGGHGEVDLRRAFAVSCNTYFINLALKLKAKNILSMASRFGFGNFTGVKNQGIDESAGNLPPINGFYTDGDTANISIGQGDILVTPLQVADMVATVANGGVKNRINIVDAIVDDDGNRVRNCKTKNSVRIISEYTARKIMNMMEEVTTINGTAPKANLDRYGGAGGKTGSAEGPYIDGIKTVHAWFAGYFPKNKPKYSVAVFVENGRNGGETAAPIFARIAEEIMKKGL